MKAITEAEFKRQKDFNDYLVIMGVKCFIPPKRQWMKKRVKHRIKKTEFQGYAQINIGKLAI